PQDAIWKIDSQLSIRHTAADTTPVAKMKPNTEIGLSEFFFKRSASVIGVRMTRKLPKKFGLPKVEKILLVNAWRQINGSMPGVGAGKNSKSRNWIRPYKEAT